MTHIGSQIWNRCYIPIVAHTKLISIDNFRKLMGKVESERDKIAIQLLFATGMRVGELVTTKLEYIDTVGGIIYICASRTKARQYRYVVVLESMIPDLKRWIERRSKQRLKS